MNANSRNPWSRGPAAWMLAAGLLALPSVMAPPAARAQSYRTLSKSCGECHKPVSINAKVGDTCPHCRVTWGVQNNKYVNQPAPATSRPAAQNNSGATFRATRAWCEGCGGSVSLSSREGDNCPHCGATWTRTNRYSEGTTEAGPAGPPYQPRLALFATVDALKRRHAAVVTALPTGLLRCDPRVMHLMQQLPLSAQEAYLLTVEDYHILSPDEQQHFAEVLRALAGLNYSRRRAFVEEARAEFRLLESSPSELAAARRDAFGTFLRLEWVLGGLE